MSEQIDSTNMERKGNVSMKVVVKWISTIIAFLAAVYFVIYFGHGGLVQGRLAQFGDFVGGTLNPLLGFFTVGLLIWSIQIQIRELRLTREELSATKNETEMSRKAMEAQVQHLDRESQLNELTRLISEQEGEYEKLLSENISLNLRRVIRPHLLKILPHDATMEEYAQANMEKEISFKQLLYPDAKFKVEIKQRDMEIDAYFEQIESSDIKQLKLIGMKALFIAEMSIDYAKYAPNRYSKGIRFSKANNFIIPLYSFVQSRVDGEWDDLYNYSEIFQSFLEQQ